MNHIKGNTSRFGSAIQVLPSDIGKYLSSFLITAVVVVSISMLISFIENCIFLSLWILMSEIKLDLAWPKGVLARYVILGT